MGSPRLVGLALLAMLLMGFPYPAIAVSSNSKVRELDIVAVSSLPNGTYVGVAAKLTVGVACPGSGRVYVETLPLSQIDLQASTRIAAIVASRVAGVRFDSCDFFASIRANSPIVGGPSASAATSVGFAATLLGLPLRRDVVLTGMILPDGSIGPVGGLKAKLEAAASIGAKLFLVPNGQTRYVEQVVIPQTIGPVVVYRTETLVVDLVDYGRRLGVDVVPVATIYEALQIFTGGLYIPPSPVGLTQAVSSLVEQQVRNWVTALKNRLEDVIAQGDSIKAIILSSLHSYTRAYVEALVTNMEGNIRDLSDRAETLSLHGLYYSAATSYFQALSHALWRLYLLKGLNTSGSLSRIRELTESRIREIITYTHSKLSHTMCIELLDIAIAVLDRAYEALTLLNRSASETSLDKITYYLALADSRATTAELWGHLFEIADGPSSSCCPIREGYLEDAVVLLESIVYNIYTYIISFEGSARIPSDTLNEMVSRMNLMMKSENPVDRLSLGVGALAYGYTTLVNMFSQDVNSTAETLVRSISTGLASDILRNCLPVSLVLYMELQSTQNETSVFRVYTLSRLSALISFYTDSLMMRPSSITPVLGSPDVIERPATPTLTVTQTIYMERGISQLAYTVLGALIGALLVMTALLVTGRTKPRL